MKHEDLMYLFLNYCSKTSLGDVKRLLSKHYNEIDLTYNNGKAFIIAGQNKSIDLMELLLNHYNATKLQSSNTSNEYQNAYTVLQDILIEVQGQCEISEKMQSIFDIYNIHKIDTISNTENTDACTTNSRNEQEKFLLEEETKDSDISTNISPVIVGEQEINNTLLLTSDNLIAKNYRYMALNIQAIHCFEKDNKDCLIHITDAAMLVTSNNDKSANIEYKSVVLYNYLKFHQKFANTVPNDKLGLIVINQIENFFKEYIIFIATKDSNIEVLNIFLSNYSSLDISDQHGQTPLHWASDNPAITQILLNIMSNDAILKQAEGNHNYTALHLAVHHKNNKVVELHLNKAPELSNIQDKFGQTPLHWASDNPEITQVLLNTMSNNSILKQAEGNYNYTALHLAVHHKNSQVVELHLNKAPELSNIQDKFGQTPLHWASDNPEITEMLLNVNLENFLTGSSSSTESIIDESRGILHNEVKLLGNIDDMSLTENNESYEFS